MLWEMMLETRRICGKAEQHRHLSDNLWLNIHDHYHFMCIPDFPLKGLLVSLCMCVKESAWVYNSELIVYHKGVCLQAPYIYVFVCVCMYCACAYVFVTWGHNSVQDSFIKCGAASEAVVNQFYMLCVRGQLSWHPWTLTPQEWTDWPLLLQLCCCRLVVKMDYSWFILTRTWFTWGKRTGSIAFCNIQFHFDNADFCGCPNDNLFYFPSTVISFFF